MSDTIIQYSIHEGVATIHLNDGKANALSYEMIVALSSAIEQAESEARVAVIMGMPGKFCAGFDLKVMQQSMSAAVDLLKAGGSLYVQMLRCSIPLLSACTGHAVAGGALLLAYSDYSIGVEGPFKLGLNEVHIGLPLPLLAIDITRHKLDPRRLNEATALGRLYSPSEAQEVGYLNETTSPEAFEETIQKRAQALTQINAVAFRETKKRLWGALATQIEDTLESDLGAINNME
jgi:enoyl-CoA hydratase